MKLTLQRLVELDACEEQREIFAEMFGTEVEVTEELCAKVANTFDWNWAVKNLLDAAAHAEYERTVNSAYAEYTRAIKSAYVEYTRTIAPASAEYERVRASARAEYMRVKAITRDEYNRARATTFAKLYNSQG